MRILILNQSFHPDFVAVAQLSSDLAAALAAEGHAVTVVASRQAYTDPKVRFPSRETWRGCDVRRVSSPGLGKGAKWRRILDTAALLAAFLWQLICLPRFDVVVAMTHPPMVAVLAALATRCKGGRLLYWVMDLNPDEAIAAGWLSARSPVARILNRALRFTLLSSHRIIVLDRFMRQRIEDKGVPAERISVIPPWSRDDLVHYDLAGRVAFRAAHGLTDKFVVMYGGNMTPVHPLDTLLLAAAELRDRTDIVFCFVGGGNALPEVRAFAAECGLRNVVCIPYLPLGEVGTALSAADLHTVVMGEAMVSIVHPCKIYNVLALGIPILHIGPPRNHIVDMLDSVRTEGAAYHAFHGDVGTVTASIVDAAARRLRTVDELKTVVTPFSQSTLVRKVVRVLELTAETQASPALMNVPAPED
jgi:glycosyltransferase involved in cell wall biosynthesis